MEDYYKHTSHEAGCNVLQRGRQHKSSCMSKKYVHEYERLYTSCSILRNYMIRKYFPDYEQLYTFKPSQYIATVSASRNKVEYQTLNQ